jgi:hypothetical protein
MDGYGIAVHTATVGSSRYRAGDTDSMGTPRGGRVRLREAARLAGASPTSAFGNGDHEFRMWATTVDGFVNFDHPGLRWAEWYVDVEINGHRWRYRPLADLDDADKADGLATRAAELYPDVTRIWVGRSDGSEEYESEVFED